MYKDAKKSISCIDMKMNNYSLKRKEYKSPSVTSIGPVKNVTLAGTGSITLDSGGYLPDPS